MRESIERKTTELMSLVKTSTEYSQYLNYQSLLSGRSDDLLAKVNEYRRRCFDIQADRQADEYDIYERLLSLRREFGTILDDPIVKKFLEVDLQLARLISRIYERMAEELAYDLDFLK